MPILRILRPLFCLGILAGSPAALGQVQVQSGDIVAADCGAGEVVLIDPATGGQQAIATGLSCPWDVHVTKDGRLFTSLFGNDTILEINLREGTTATVTAGGQINGPNGIDRDEDGVLYIADSTGITAVEPDGTQRDLGIPAAFYTDVALDPAEDFLYYPVFVEVLRFPVAGSTLAPEQVATGGLLSCGQDIAFHPDGTAWLTDQCATAALIQYDLAWNGTQILSNTTVPSVGGLAISSGGDVYVGNRTAVIRASDSATIASGLASISGLTVVPDQCGNGIVEGDEGCDDGNLLDGDCCSARCELAPATQTCRAAAGPCDQPELCTGTSTVCPEDLKAAAGDACRAATGECDLVEYCDGITDACPADALATAGTQCRAADGDCDAEEVCTGTSTACPDDRFALAGTTCRPSAGICDVEEACTGTSSTCPEDGFQIAAVLCRNAAGPCDVDEFCTGAHPACPSDRFADTSSVCRPAVDACDEAERCDGQSAACPDDGLLPEGTVCGTSSVCANDRVCTGTTAICPEYSDEDCPPVDRPDAGAGPSDDPVRITGGGCGCRAQDQGTAPTEPWPLLGFAALWLWRRERRRAPRV